jgi:RpiB/LacA/LacB family sugar-phosphate isomerase
MRVALGCDHGGFPLKAELSSVLATQGHELIDCGTYSEDPVDYPRFASEVARVLLDGNADRGIVLCGSGVGAAVAANKVKGIRAGLCHDTYSAHQGVEHDNINVLCLGARVVGPSLAKEIVIAFLEARFSGEERHLRRLQLIEELEDEGKPL